MQEPKNISQNTKYLMFVILAVVLLVMGFVLSPSIGEMIDGYKVFISHPSTLDFDGLQQAGHFGTAFFNSGLLLLVVLAVYKITKTDLQGVQIAAAMMVMGFAFYGKNIVNIWFPVLGVLGHTAYGKKPLSSGTALAWFSTALSPVFSVMAYGTEVLVPGSFGAIATGAVFGFVAGWLLSVVAGHLPKLHNGYVLFNAGFAAGIAGIFINAAQKGFGIGHDKFPYVETAQAVKDGIPSDYVSGSNLLLGGLLAILFICLIVMGFALGGAPGFKQLLAHKGRSGNHVEQFGFAATLMHMGFIGFVATLFVFVTVKGQLQGPVFGCIWTAVGFAANGVTIRQYLPTMAGVFIMALLTGGIVGAMEGQPFIEAALTKAGTRGMLLAAIFSCGLSPIVGEFGVLAGMLVGALHCLLVPNTGGWHGWMSLYNNGLSLSIIATFMYPVFSALARKKEPAS